MRKYILTFVFTLSVACLMGQGRFLDNFDGTVTDLGTGLVWQKCSMGQNPLDCAGTETTTTWQGALQYCRSLPLDGRSWRLPNINELTSIVDYTKSGPAVDTSIFPNTPSGSSKLYWSSTTSSGTSSAIYVDFTSGATNQTGKTLTSPRVRCVADGP
ncbi:MAG: DUF1566 domain-containing protein [Spirochaetes bacterium]|nr:DUF1566 domain-containing protein [Spirochaetota bacterium]